MLVGFEVGLHCLPRAYVLNIKLLVKDLIIIVMFMWFLSVYTTHFLPEKTMDLFCTNRNLSVHLPLKLRRLSVN